MCGLGIEKGIFRQFQALCLWTLPVLFLSASGIGPHLENEKRKEGWGTLLKWSLNILDNFIIKEL